MTRLPNLSRKKMLAIASVCMLSIVPAFAQDEDMEDLDLGELFDLNMEVTVASKKAEKLSDAPGMIVAYSDNDMENLGLYTIRDLANITTGYSSQYNVGEQTLETRGQKVSGFDNNKHLLMVDGIPVRHVRAGKVPVEEGMSLYGAKRVEFMKGPGSALYGTGAFYGVVNVVGKDLSEEGTVAGSRMAFGTENMTKEFMSYIVSRNENGQFRASGSFFDKESGSEFVKTADGATNNPEFRNWNDRNGISLNANYTHNSGVGVGFIYSKKTSGLGEFWGSGSSQLNDITWETIIPYVKFKRDFSDVVSFNSYLLGNHSVEKTYQNPGYTDYDYVYKTKYHIGADGVTDTINMFYAQDYTHYDTLYNNGLISSIDTTTYTLDDATVLDTIGGGWAGVYERKALDMELLAEVSLDFDNVGTFIAGVNYDVRRTLATDDFSTGEFDYWEGAGIAGFPVRGLGKHDESEAFHTISFYAQYQKEFPLLSGLLLTAGMREDIGKTKTNSFNQFSPRAGLVQRLTDFLSLKLLYGTALRAPGVKEVGINTEAKENPNYTGDIPQLEAENIKSYEAGLNLVFPKITVALAAFYNESANSLGTTRIDGSNLSTNIPGVIIARGVDADLRAMPVKYLKLLLGYSRSIAFNTVSNSTMVGVPTQKINGALMFMTHTKVPVTFTPSVNYTLAIRNGGDLDDAVEIKSDNGDFYNIDINTTVQPFEHFGFELMVKNISDNEAYRLSEFTNVGIKSAPRSFKFAVNAKF